jgi:hypothetical protein
MKLITLILGLALGFGGGIWYGVQHPEWAKDFAAKEAEWVRQGKEQAFEFVKSKLDTKLAQEQTPSTPGGRSFAGNTASAGTSTDVLKSLKGDVEAQLNQVKK